ncbi:MAG: hypothetical protein QNK37_20745 [Acidobacteriota bacterium]|nr:hypothetical protein [Acidobacteriota bacterium]
MVLWADDDFQAKKVLAEVPAIDHPANARLVMPARDKPSFTVSRDKKRIFIYPGKGKFEIQIYDVVRRQFLPSIVKDRPRIPFDEEYGEERFRKLLSYQGRARHQQSRFKPIYPEYFPAVEHLAVDLDGYLIVWPGVHMMNKKTPALVLGETGREIKPRFPPKHHARLLAVDGDYVYVSVYRDEEIGVRKVLISELDRFFQEYPDNG